jgi:Na+/proline symporter
MIGAFGAAYFALAHPAVGGLGGLISNPAVTDKLSLLPDFTDPRAALAAFIIPVAVQWWSTWYPGAEPGGGGYVAQRMLAAKDEKDSMRSTLIFNILHYALRPWPWIIVALASLVVYPDLAAIAERFPHIDPSILRDDLAYPAMLVFVPHGFLGLIVASLAAAYMSTVATHLNWGSSYIVDDFYRRFARPDADDRHYVTVARISTIMLAVLAGVVSLWLENAFQAFQILLQIGAGTGLIFLLRWFWWRINAWSEISAMVMSFLVAIYFEFVHEGLGFTPLDFPYPLIIGVAITTAGWVTVTLLTPVTDTQVLQSFYDKIRPYPRGWKAAVQVAPEDDGRESISTSFLCWFLGCLVVYSALFGTGYLLYGRVIPGIACIVVLVIAGRALFRALPRVHFI